VRELSLRLSQGFRSLQMIGEVADYYQRGFHPLGAGPERRIRDRPIASSDRAGEPLGVAYLLSFGPNRV
jgi:hypothetical protein